MRKIRRSRNSGRRRRKAGRATLSVCMVVKNEEGRMATFMEGLKGLANEVVVVDTGSSDRTVEIAERSGAKVDRQIWNDDFSEVRNSSLRHATGDWILTLDADEIIHPRDFASLRQTILNGGADAYRLLTRNYSSLVHAAGWRACSGEYPAMERGFRGWYPTIKVRLFRRDERIRFTGCVHELVESSILENGGIIRNCPVPIHHFGAWNERARREKEEFYLRLGRKKVEQQPDDPRAHFELGVQYLSLGEPEKAEATFRKAVVLQERTPAARLRAVYHYPSETYNMLGVTLERLGRPREALTQYQKAVELNPRCVEALTNWGLLMERQGKFAGAQEKYQTALGIDPDSGALRDHLLRVNALIDADTARAKSLFLI